MFGFTLFNKNDLSNELTERQRALENEIQNESPDRILNVEPEDYVEYIVRKYQFEPGNLNPNNAQLESKQLKPNDPVYLLIPYSGNTKLLEYRPRTHTVGVSYRGEVNPVLTNDQIEGELYELRVKLDPRRAWTEDNLQREINDAKSYLKKEWQRVESDIKRFEERIENRASNLYEDRRKEILQQQEMFDSVDVPLRKQDDTPDTFAVDAPKRRPIIEKPQPAGDAASGQVPVVTQKKYLEILETIFVVGRGFERRPALFEGYSEEELRDLILFFLEMNFEGTATGETFNKDGKSDILLRWEDGTNVFVAECAMWQGEQYFTGKINQLYRYLTWRDSKAAVILFVDRADMEPVREQIESGMEGHENILDLVERHDESWWQFKANFPDDQDRVFDLSVLAFHIPT